VIADAQAPSRKDSLASSAPAGTDCPECAAWVEHDYYRVTAGQLTIQGACGLKCGGLLKSINQSINGARRCAVQVPRAMIYYYSPCDG
jgi:bacterioferritin-associated ferredoxin